MEKNEPRLDMREKPFSRKEQEKHQRYYLCSIPPVAELFALVVRRHWHIENGLHWVLDLVFKEDQLRSKEKNGILFLN